MYKVVLVDDERLIVEGLSRVVTWHELGGEVAGCAIDGREGLALIRQIRPDIVLTDIRMPNMDGLTMLAAGGGMLGLGLFRRGQQRRFPRYLAFINQRRAVSFREIASAMGLSRRKVIRDLERMLDQGLLNK